MAKRRQQLGEPVDPPEPPPEPPPKPRAALDWRIALAALWIALVFGVNLRMMIEFLRQVP